MHGCYGLGQQLGLFDVRRGFTIYRFARLTMDVKFGALFENLDPRSHERFSTVPKLAPSPAASSIWLLRPLHDRLLSFT